MKKILPLFFTAAAAALVLAAAVWQFSGNDTTAPALTYQTLDGQVLDSHALQGKVVLVKFWATSCVTCVQQMPDTVKVFEDFSAQGYEVIAVAMDYDPAAYVRHFTETRKLPFAVVHDRDGAIARAFGNVQLTPTAFLIDKKGRIVKRYLGNYDLAAFVRTVEQALARST